MSENVLAIYKKRGQTPLECIIEAKKDHPQWLHEPMTYAGRLDPLASGVLLILVGDECLKKDEYLALPKEYDVTILFGFATDTYDVMGKVTQSASRIGISSGPRVGSPDAEEIAIRFAPDTESGMPFEMVWPRSFTESRARRSEDLSKGIPDEVALALKNFTGRFSQAYPPYSSRTVDGKPLFQWAREGKLDQIAIPSHDVVVESIDIIEWGNITSSDLHQKIQDDIHRVTGDFRQIEILELWNQTLIQTDQEEFPTVKLRILCGSGVYVRSIAHELGIALGVPALALDIVRTKVGDYSIE